MNRATTVLSVADVDPDSVAGELPLTDPTDSVVPDGYAADEAAAPDYMADYDDDQTSGIEEDGVDQRIPFT